jgi:hypothetical protein
MNLEPRSKSQDRNKFTYRINQKQAFCQKACFDFGQRIISVSVVISSCDFPRLDGIDNSNPFIQLNPAIREQLVRENEG